MADAAASDGGLRRTCFLIAAFGSLLIPGILQAGIVPQEMGAILADFGLTRADFGYLAGGIAAAASVLGLSAAWLAPRLGIYRVCLLGYFLFAFGLGSAALYPAGALAIAMGTLTALGLAYLHLGNGLVVGLDPKRPAAMTNLLHGVNSFGKAIGPLFSKIGSSWNAPFLAIAGLGAALGLLGLFGRRPASAKMAAVEQRPAREALGRPLFWICGLMFVPIVAMEQMVVIWLPGHLKSAKVFGPEEGAAAALLANSIILWTELIARLGASWLLTRVSPIKVLALSVPCGVAILIGSEAGIWDGPAGVAALMACGIAFATPWPTFFAIASRSFPNHHGLLAMASGAGTSLAIVLSYTVGGAVAHHVGLEWTLRISPLLGVLVLLGALCVDRMAGSLRV